MLSACTYSSCSHYTSAPCHQAQAHSRANPYGYSQFQVHTEAFVTPAIFIYIRCTCHYQANGPSWWPISPVLHGITECTRAHGSPCCALVTSEDTIKYISFITYGHTRYNAWQGVDGFCKYRMLYPCNILENQAVTVVRAIRKLDKVAGA